MEVVVKVEMWSEVTCPWCGLGNHRLDRALEGFEHRDRVEVVHHSFPLGGDFPAAGTLTVREVLLDRYGLAGDSAEASTRRIEALAAAEGLSPYRVLDNTVGSTDLAHEFLAHASAEGKNREGWGAIFDAYFGRAQPVFAVEDLLNLGETLGLDRDGTRAVLTERRYRSRVRDDARRAQSLGATGAPFFVVDGRYSVSGAQDAATLLDLLRTAWKDTDRLASAAGQVCGVGECADAPAGPPR
jgi:predicted DsbA family dithiol-disulfide isomerase